MQQLDVLNRKNAWLDKPLSAASRVLGCFESGVFYAIDARHARLVLWGPASRIARGD
jgi:hypothetical protein